jgi:hypothetical protein
MIIVLPTGFILGGFDLNETTGYYYSTMVHFTISGKSSLLLRNECRATKKISSFLLVETEMISPSVGGPLQIATVTLDLQNFVNFS